VKNSEDGSRYDSRSTARPIAALCVKQSSLPSPASTNARRRPRRSSRKIRPRTSLVNREDRALLRSEMIVASRVRQDIPRGATHRSSRCFSTRRRLLPDEVAHAPLSLLFQPRVLRSVRIAFDAGAGAERHAQHPDSARSDDTTHTTAGSFPGRRRPLVSTPRGHLRPDSMGRERPHSIRAVGQGLGDRGGSLTPHITLHRIIRAASPRQKAPRRSCERRTQRLADQSIASCGKSSRAAHRYRPGRGNRSSLRGRLRFAPLAPSSAPRILSSREIGGHPGRRESPRDRCDKLVSEGGART